MRPGECKGKEETAACRQARIEGRKTHKSGEGQKYRKDGGKKNPGREACLKELQAFPCRDAEALKVEV